jgi:hypothetical protein
MQLQNFLPPAKTILSAALIAMMAISCKKDNELTAENKTAASNTPALTVGLPPKWVFWLKGQDLPFPDNTSGVPFGRILSQGFTMNGKGYICGGLEGNSEGELVGMTDLWEYDTTTKSWSQKADYPGSEVFDGTNFAIGNSAYIIANNQNFQFNQSTNTWTKRASMPATARGFASSFAINGIGYTGFGYPLSNSLSQLKDFWQYNPVTDKWLKKGTFPGEKREGAPTFTINGKGYMCSGSRTVSGGSSVYMTDTWMYDPLVDTWVEKADFPAHGRMFSIGLTGPTNGYVATGSAATTIFHDCWQYSATTDSWFQEPAVGGGWRTAGTGWALGNILYIAAGCSSTDLQPESMIKDFWSLKL